MPRTGMEFWPKLEVGGDFDYLRSNAPPGGCGCFSMIGGDVWFAYNFTRTLAVVGQESFQTASNISSTGRNLQLINFMVGPRLNHTFKHRFIPFGQILVGASHASGSLAPGSLGFAGSPNSFAILAGGGLDIRMTSHINIRAAELDYFLTRYNNGANNVQNNLRVSVGVVYRF